MNTKPAFHIAHATSEESGISERIIDLMLATGGSISVSDGEAIVVRESRDKAAIADVMGSTGEDYLILHRTGFARGWVRLIWGNGCDLLSDYSVGLESLLRPVLDAHP
jgi:hypothetical protein